MNQAVAESAEIRRHYQLEVVPLRYARTLKDIGRPSIRKALVMCGQWVQIVHRVLLRRPNAVYYAISPSGWALVRDLCYAWILKMAQIRVVFHIHGSGIAHTAARNPILRAWLRWAFTNGIVIHLSRSLALELDGLVRPEQWRVLPNGVARPSAEVTGIVRAKDKVLFCSNIMPTKGPLVLIDALGKLHRRGIEFTADFVGPFVSREFADSCWAACRHQGITTRVRWVGARHGAEKASLFASAAVFAFPSYLPWEGVPLALLEAMSYGLASVASRQGGIHDVLDDGVNGFLVPPRDAEALAGRLMQLLLDPDLRETMGARARSAFDDRYTLDRFECGLIAILNEVL